MLDPRERGTPSSEDREARGRFMSVLALASEAELEEAWRSLPDPPSYRHLRRPEVGLAMVRARAGGTGMRFNLGEMTVTRCSVVLHDGTLGHAYVGGRRGRHAELAALFDALLQQPSRRAGLEGGVIADLSRQQAARRRAAAARAAASRVEFFTMVRGED